MAVASGAHDVVLVIGVETMRDKSSEEGLLSRAAAGHLIFTRDETAPVLLAPFATRHMHELERDCWPLRPLQLDCVVRSIS
jgi:acetyl-CoA C-acetyltransferase